MESEDVHHLKARVKQLENIVYQLLKITAASNNRIKHIEKKLNELEQFIPEFEELR